MCFDIHPNLSICEVQQDGERGRAAEDDQLHLIQRDLKYDVV